MPSVACVPQYSLKTYLAIHVAMQRGKCNYNIALIARGVLIGGENVGV